MQKMKENFASVKDLNYLCTHEQRFIESCRCNFIPNRIEPFVVSYCPYCPKALC